MSVPVELLWEEELKDPKSALHDLGKLSKFAKLAFASPPEALPVLGGRNGAGGAVGKAPDEPAVFPNESKFAKSAFSPGF